MKREAEGKKGREKERSKVSGVEGWCEGGAEGESVSSDGRRVLRFRGKVGQHQPNDLARFLPFPWQTILRFHGKNTSIRGRARASFSIPVGPGRAGLLPLARESVAETQEEDDARLMR